VLADSRFNHLLVLHFVHLHVSFRVSMFHIQLLKILRLSLGRLQESTPSS